jgi:pimeloyl-ACP methyl ester carboxylesterase
MGVDGPWRRPDEVDPGLRDRCQRKALATVHRHGDATGQALEAGAIDRLGEIRVPTRVVVGDLDSSDIHDVAERIVAQAPDATIATIPGAAHTLNPRAAPRLAARAAGVPAGP